MTRTTDAYSSRSHRLWLMLRKLGFDTERLGEPVYQSRMALMAGRCRNCPRVEACEKWMAQPSADEEYRCFCVNASLFDDLPRREQRLKAAIGKE